MNKLLITVALLSASSAAFAIELGCPPRVEVNEKLVSGYRDWSEGRSEEPHRLAGITIFDGPPSEMASLIGTDKVLSKTKTRTSWSFDGDHEHWLLCSYANTSVTLSRAIPKVVKTCAVTYSRITSIAGLPEILKLECR
jgi:hypothetical protein